MCLFKSALLIPRFPTSDGFDLFHRDGIDSHTDLMELANINPNDIKVNVAKLELVPNYEYNPTNVDTWKFILDENRRPDWLDDSMLADAEYELRQICSRYIAEDGEYTILDKSGDKLWYLLGVLQRDDGPAIEWADGGKHWYIKGLLHRDDGPAVECANGNKFWYLNGESHREDGPAIEYTDGDKEWWINGKLHREDGPAVEYHGRKEWWINGKLHREDGPAIVRANGAEIWYLNGVSFTKEEFEQKFATVPENISTKDNFYSRFIRKFMKLFSK